MLVLFLIQRDLLSDVDAETSHLAPKSQPSNSRIRLSGRFVDSYIGVNRRAFLHYRHRVRHKFISRKTVTLLFIRSDPLEAQSGLHVFLLFIILQLAKTSQHP